MNKQVAKPKRNLDSAEVRTDVVRTSSVSTCSGDTQAQRHILSKLTKFMFLEHDEYPHKVVIHQIYVT